MENYKSCIHSDYSIFSACNPDWHAPLTSLYANPAVKGEKKALLGLQNAAECFLLENVFPKKAFHIIFKWISTHVPDFFN